MQLVQLTALELALDLSGAASLQCAALKGMKEKLTGKRSHVAPQQYDHCQIFIL